MSSAVDDEVTVSSALSRAVYIDVEVTVSSSHSRAVQIDDAITVSALSLEQSTLMMR